MRPAQYMNQTDKYETAAVRCGEGSSLLVKQKSVPVVKLVIEKVLHGV